ncbi:hypothetical protein [Nannocystis pusilla]|uniref:hypothetical protein n=1 Tax=Nannocystis pusilla TaxID=889268 RepID=UPI003B7B009E
MNGTPLDDRAGARNTTDPTRAPDYVGRFGFAARPGKHAVSGGVSLLYGTGFHRGSEATKNKLEWSDLNENGAIDTGELVAVPGQAATPSLNFRRWAVGADFQVGLRSKAGWTQILAEGTIASNLDRDLIVADPVVVGADLRELHGYVAVIQELFGRAVVGARYDYYDPNTDLLDRRRGEFVPKAAAIHTISPIAGALLPPGWIPGVRGRLVFQYDAVLDALGRDSRGVPANLKNDQFIIRLQGNSKGHARRAARIVFHHRLHRRSGAADRPVRADPRARRRAARRRAAARRSWPEGHLARHLVGHPHRRPARSPAGRPHHRRRPRDRRPLRRPRQRLVGAPGAGQEPDVPRRARLPAPPRHRRRRPPGVHTLLLAAIDEAGRRGPAFELEVCVRDDGLPDNLNACDATIPPPALVITLEWDQDVDLDLVVETPGGKKIAHATPTSGEKVETEVPAGVVKDPTTGRLVRDSNAGCAIDGRNSESVVFQEPPARGTYLIYADLFDACGAPGTLFSAAVYRRVEQGDGTFALVEDARTGGALVDLQATGGGQTPLYVMASKQP